MCDATFLIEGYHGKAVFFREAVAPRAVVWFRSDHPEELEIGGDLGPVPLPPNDRTAVIAPEKPGHYCFTVRSPGRVESCRCFVVAVTERDGITDLGFSVHPGLNGEIQVAVHKRLSCTGKTLTVRFQNRTEAELTVIEKDPGSLSHKIPPGSHPKELNRPPGKLLALVLPRTVTPGEVGILQSGGTDQADIIILDP